MDAKEGEFDRFAPENISAVVGWLASDLSEGVTGQVVKVMGGQVQLLRGGGRSPRPPTTSRGRSTSIEAAPTRCSRSPRRACRRSCPNIGDN